MTTRCAMHAARGRRPWIAAGVAAWLSMVLLAGQPLAEEFGIGSKAPPIDIEWIGDPMELDEPLERIVAGTWDRASFLAEKKAMDTLQEKLAPIGRLVAAAGSAHHGRCLQRCLLGDKICWDPT